jgi:hypothetical protein
MEIDNRGAILVKEVAEKTAARKLKWQPTAREGVYVTSLGGKYAVRLFPYETLNATGATIGTRSLTLYEANEMLLDVTQKTNGVTLEQLDELYAAVERQIHRVDEKNESIQEALSLLKDL